MGERERMRKGTYKHFSVWCGLAKLQGSLNELQYILRIEINIDTESVLAYRFIFRQKFFFKIFLLVNGKSTFHLSSKSAQVQFRIFYYVLLILYIADLFYIHPERNLQTVYTFCQTIALSGSMTRSIFFGWRVWCGMRSTCRHIHHWHISVAES